MRLGKRTDLVLIASLCCVLAAAAGYAAPQVKSAKGKATVELPAAVAKAIKDNRPDAEIDKVDVEKDAGIALYDVEFKAGQGEIEVAEDGTVIDISTIIEMKDVPVAAADAIRKAAAGARIEQLERSEVRAEVVKRGGKGAVSKLATPRTVYEAELVKGKERGEIQVAPDGKIVEALKWSGQARE